VGIFGFVHILIKIYLFHSIWVSIQSTDSSTNQPIISSQNSINFLLYLSECIGKCSQIGIVGEVGIIIEIWGNPKLMPSSYWGTALQKAWSNLPRESWTNPEIESIGTKTEHLREKSEIENKATRDFEIEALHQEPEPWEVLTLWDWDLQKPLSSDLQLQAGCLRWTKKSSQIPLLKIFSVPLHGKASAENLRKSPDSGLQKAKFSFVEIEVFVTLSYLMTSIVNVPVLPWYYRNKSMNILDQSTMNILLFLFM